MKIRKNILMLSILYLAASTFVGADNLNEKILKTNQKVSDAISFLESSFGLTSENFALIVEPSSQKMFLIKNRKIEKIYIISTGKKGLGCESGSYKTPIGVHVIKDKIGKNAKVGTIFQARKNTKKIAKIYKEKKDVPEDYVTTRILRLAGLEKGKNKGKGVDSYLRYIYIHGTPEEGLLGKPVSHGCIRMNNIQIVELFDVVKEGTLVYILEK